MVVGRYALAVLVLLLLPFVSAYSISSAQLTWDGHIVTTISPTKSLPNTIPKLTLSADFSECFTAYASEVCALSLTSPQLGWDALRLDVRGQCSQSAGTYNNLTNTTADAAIVCTMPPLVFATQNSSVDITYFSQVGPNRNLDTQTVSIPITLDATIPVVSSIATGYCDAGVCYIASGVPTPYEITMQDSLTAFEYKLVFVGARGSVERVDECVGSVCRGSVTIPCTDGERLEMRAAALAGVSSREDAQNDVAQNSSQVVVCAARAPKILNWSMQADGIVGLAVSGGKITVTARVEPTTIPKIEARVNATQILGQQNGSGALTSGSCSPASDDTTGKIYTCTWQLSGIQPGEFDLRFEVADAVGNVAVLTDKGAQSVHVTVLNLAAPPGNKSLDLYAATAGEVRPGMLNRMALELARANHLPFPTYVPYTLTAKGKTTRVYHQELTSCVYKLPNETNYTAKYNLFAFGGDRPESHTLYEDGTLANRLNLQIRAAPEVLALSDTFDVRCIVELTVGQGNDIYNVPEKENITFQVKLRETVLGQPGSEFVERIKKEEDDLSGSAQDFLIKLRQVRSTMDGICTTFAGLKGLASVLTGSENALEIQEQACIVTCSSVTLGIGGPGCVAACMSSYNAAQTGVGGTRKGVETTIDKTWLGNIFKKNGKDGGFVRKVCAQVNCQGNTAGLYEEIVALNTAWVGDYCGSAATGTTPGRSFTTDMCNNVAIPNPKDSFVMSALTLCAGGMIYNAGKWQDINCGYLQCLKEQSLNGANVRVCQDARNHKYCTQFVGEVFELPFVSVVKNFAENINNMIEQLPQYLISWGINGYCKPQNYAPGLTFYQIACHYVKDVLDIVDYAQMTQRGFNEPMSDNAICLQALCNPAKEDCGSLSYNKIQALDQYTKYLNLQNVIRDSVARQTREETRSAANAKSALSNIEKAYQTSRGCKDGQDCKITSIVRIEEEKPSMFEGAYSKSLPSIVEQPEVDPIPSLQNPNKALAESAKSSILGPNPSSTDQQKSSLFPTESKEYFAQPDIADPSIIQPLEAVLPPTYQEQEKSSLFGPTNTITLDQSGNPVNPYYYTYGIQGEAGDAVITDVKTRQALNQLPQDVFEPTSETKADGTKVYSNTQEIADLKTSLAAGYIPEDEADLKKFVTTFNRGSASAPIAEYELCLGAKGQSAQSCGVVLDRAGIGLKDGEYFVTTSGKQWNEKVIEKACAITSGTSCTFNVEDNGATAKFERRSDGSLVRCDDAGDCSKGQTVGAVVGTGEGLKIKNVERRWTQSQFGQFILTTAVQILRDKGYLDFLSISYWGDWGIELVATSNTYLTKEGWANNICNEAKFDLNDGDDGAIYLLSEENNARPVGTFAVERAHLEGPPEQYAYLLTILIANPQREAPNGISDEDWATYNDFKLDARLDGLKGCANAPCNASVDLIDGSFDLQYGATFGDGRGPKSALLYLPGEYTRICVTFDKSFPDENGKREFCREINENIYNRGSPVRAPIAAASGSSTTTPTGSTSTGCLLGSISGC